MRPKDKHFWPDNKLKQHWLDNDPHIDRDDVFVVFDDRNQVVDMWRNELKLTCFQVAEGNF